MINRQEQTVSDAWLEYQFCRIKSDRELSCEEELDRYWKERSRLQSEFDYRESYLYLDSVYKKR